MFRPDDFLETTSAKLDLGRQQRCGFPEVIYGESKTAEQIANIARIQYKQGIDVLATRVSSDKAEFALPLIKRVCKRAYYNEVGRTIRAPRSRGEQSPFQGRVAILTAGTSDLPVAQEARETALWTGAKVALFQDVGVAGPQRLLAVLPKLENVDAIVVIAGMEGALPSVVGGYVAAPIVAVPTSVGYGASFNGLAALLGMINSCSSNVTVVNIDAGFKGGYVAGLIAKNAAKAAEMGYNEAKRNARSGVAIG